jgi:hypothetical protein
VYQRKRIRRGWNGRYLGFRMNCEYVPGGGSRFVKTQEKLGHEARNFEIARISNAAARMMQVHLQPC